MDNPLSWLILLILVIAGLAWCVKEIEAEKAQYRAENDEFFRRREGRF